LPFFTLLLEIYSFNIFKFFTQYITVGKKRLHKKFICTDTAQILNVGRFLILSQILPYCNKNINYPLMWQKQAPTLQIYVLQF